MAVFQVENDAEFNSAIGLATGLDTIELANGAAFGQLLVPNTAVDGVTIAGQSIHGHTIERLTVGEMGGGIQGLTLNGLYVQHVDTDYHPELSQKKAPLYYFANPNVDGLRILHCKARVGDHLNSMANWDTANTGGKYAELFGDGASGNWDVAGGAPGLYNVFYSMPDLLSIGNAAGSIWIEECDFEDGFRGVVMTPLDVPDLVMRRNRFSRLYGDCNTIGFGVNAFTRLTRLELTGFEFLDPCWCQPQDNGNPHGDPIQIFSTDTGTANDSDTPIENMLIAGHVIKVTAGYRGQNQRLFFSDTPLGYPFIGSIVWENFLLSRITSAGITISNGPPSRGAAFCIVGKNTNLVRPNKNVPVQNELFVNPSTGVPVASPSAANIGLNQEPSMPGRSLVINNFTEAATNNTSVTLVGNVITGEAAGGSHYNAHLAAPPADDAAWDALSDDALFQAFRCSTAGVGAVQAGMTIQDLLDKWSQDVKPLSELPSWLGFAVMRNAPLATEVSSGRIFVQAGMESRMMTPGPGVSYFVHTGPTGGSAGATRLTDPRLTAHGEWIEFFFTTTNVSAAQHTLTVQLGTDTFEWRVKNVDLVQYPHAVWPSPADAIFRQTAAQALGTAESTMLTGLIECQFPAGNPAITQTVMQKSAGTFEVSFAVLATTGRGRITLRNAAGTVVAQGDTSTDIADGTMKRVLFSCNTALAVDEEALTIYVNDVLDQTGIAVTQDALLDLDDGAAALQVGGVGSTPSFVCDALGPVVFWPGVWVDLADDAEREKFSPSNAGPNFEALTGTSPRVALCNTAAQINLGLWNVGSGNEFTKLMGTDLVAFDANPWPPVLTLVASVLTVGDLIIGQPIDILVSASGYPKSINITAASDGAGAWDANPQNMPLGSNGITFTFTPSALGAHSVTFTNDGGYNNPAALALTIVEEPPPPVDLGDYGIKRSIKRAIKRSIKRARS